MARRREMPNSMRNIGNMASSEMVEALNVSGIEPSVWFSILQEEADTREEANARIAEELAEYAR